MYLISGRWLDAGDVDACGNDMEGVPYISVVSTIGKRRHPNHLGHGTNAGDAVADGVLVGVTNISDCWLLATPTARAPQCQPHGRQWQAALDRNGHC